MIIKLINKIREFFHNCSYEKILVSKYVSFNTRDIIAECSCGKRKRIRTDHDSVYPILTNIRCTEKDMNYILENK